MRKFTISQCRQCNIEIHISTKHPEKKFCSHSCASNWHARNRDLPLDLEHNSTDGTIRFPLSGNSGLSVLLDEIDIDLTRLRWHAHSKVVDGAAYAIRSAIKADGEQTTVYLHRVVLSRALGRELQRGEWADHSDGNRANCTRSNLRLASPSQNGMNKASTSSATGHKGVCWAVRAKKYVAHITVDRKRRHLGYFEQLEDAVKARADAAKELHKDFARD
jgi:hypothetical protein